MEAHHPSGERQVHRPPELRLAEQSGRLTEVADEDETPHLLEDVLHRPGQVQEEARHVADAVREVDEQDDVRPVPGPFSVDDFER